MINTLNDMDYFNTPGVNREYGVRIIVNIARTPEPDLDPVVAILAYDAVQNALPFGWDAEREVLSEGLIANRYYCRDWTDGFADEWHEIGYYELPADLRGLVDETMTLAVRSMKEAIDRPRRLDLLFKTGWDLLAEVCLPSSLSHRGGKDFLMWGLLKESGKEIRVSITYAADKATVSIGNISTTYKPGESNASVAQSVAPLIAISNLQS